MKKHWLYIAVSTALLALSALAESSPSPAPQPSATPPAGPLIKRAPIPIQWTVTYKWQPQVTGTQGSTSPKVTTVTKDQDAVFEETSNDQGTRIEKWFLANVVVTGVNGQNWFLTAGGQNGFDVTNYSKVDFPGFDWISLPNFAGDQEVMGRHCLIFKGKAVTASPDEVSMVELSEVVSAQLQMADKVDKSKGKGIASPTPIPHGTMDTFAVDVTAYIDDATRLPLVLVYPAEGGTMTRIYQFQTPAQPLVVPENIRQLINNYKQRQKKTAAGVAPI